MRERDLERYTTMVIKSHGGLALKFISTGYAGVPDRLVLMPGGKMCFMELKAPGRKPRPLQVRRIEQLRALGFKVYVVDGKEEIGGIINAL
ncbi:VRR-NUC domain-containing protein [uncultured Selenomonas sp.]|uniref:VRR-NUC domain-containing protein n=1 Tax=uncultured Selenomonas sp. TaxID=159275 RepID=UPI0028E9B786|nr:VRR-NUC domain-containing protein [uncultured Selenomonas sp.]